MVPPLSRTERTLPSTSVKRPRSPSTWAGSSAWRRACVGSDQRPSFAARAACSAPSNGLAQAALPTRAETRAEPDASNICCAERSSPGTKANAGRRPCRSLSSPSFFSVTSRLPRIFSSAALLASGVSIPARRTSRPSVSTKLRPSSTARTMPVPASWNVQPVSCAAAVRTTAAAASMSADSNASIANATSEPAAWRAPGCAGSRRRRSSGGAGSACRLP